MSLRETITGQLGSISAMPVVVGKLRHLLSDPDVEFRKLSEVLKYDPGMTTNILRLANSAYFGFRTQVNTVTQAISRLGLKRMSELVMTAAIGPIMQRPLKGYEVPAGGLWRHSIAVAIATEHLAGQLNIPVPEDAFTAGLLHDIGKMVLGTFIEVDTDPIMKLVDEKKIPFDEAEREILGIDHAEVGSLLLKKWNLPESLVNVTRWHHAPHLCEEKSVVLNLVHIADSISLMSGIGTGQDGLAYNISKEATDIIPINIKIIESCAVFTMQKVSELSELFETN